ncbi:MAG: hypothetical protein AMJ79_08455 [Phycisphaerae bacterium SM23_30]|nr:MAG: hypothetical protein AMJ79_08455 [Phycisphaerae bacterium SM23_30]
MSSRDFDELIFRNLPVMGLLFLGIFLLSAIGCGDRDAESEVKEAEVAPEGKRVKGKEDDSGSGYFFQEDFSRNKFRITYSSETNNFITLRAEGTKEPFKVQHIEAVMELSPAGTNAEGQRELRLETNHIVLDSKGVKVDSREPLPNKEYVSNPMRYDIQKALRMLAGLKLTLSIDENNKIVNISGSELTDKISRESEGFKAFINSFRPLFEQKIAQSGVMAAADYLPIKEAKVGSEWNSFIVNEQSGIGQLPLWTVGRLEEIFTVKGQKQGRISFNFTFANADEIDTKWNSQPAQITKMNLEGTGSIVFNLAENFAGEFSLHMRGRFEMVWQNEVKGEFLMDEKVRLIKEIIQDGTESMTKIEF